MGSRLKNEMDEERKVVVVTGVPVTMNPQKLKLDFIKHNRVRIESVSMQEDEAKVIFQTTEDAISFCSNPPTSLKFGGKQHPIQISSSLPRPDVAVDVLSVHPDLTTLEEDKIIECDKVHNWSELSKLPIPKKGVLVQDFPPQITPSDIKEYFESAKSEGGKVLQVRFMVDGVLVLFQSNEAAVRVWNYRPHRIDDMPLALTLKEVPEYYLDRFAFEFMEETGDEHVATKFLHDKFPEYEAKDVTRTPTQFFLVTFREKLTQDILSEIIKQFQDNQDFKVRAVLLPMTDCLRIEGVKKLSNSEIITLFENQERIGGGRVTRLDRVKGNAVLLYFASYQDAERIFTKFGTKNLSVFNCELKIFRYYHLFYESHYKVGNENTLDKLIGAEGWPQASYFYRLSESMSQFLTKKTTDLDILKKALCEIATLSLEMGGINIALCMKGSNLETSPSSEVMIVNKCRRIIHKFLLRYEDFELNHVTSDEFSDIQSDERLYAWKGTQNQKLTICGPKAIVEEYAMNQSQLQRVMNLQPDEYRWILECKYLEKDRKYQRTCSLNHESKTLLFRVKDEEQLAKQKEEVTRQLKNLDRRVFLDSEKLILEFVASGKNQPKVNRKFRETVGDKMNVIVGGNGQQPYLYGQTEKLTEAHVVLRGLCTVESAEVSSKPASIFQMARRLQKEHHISVDIDTKTSFLKIAGFVESVRTTKQALDRTYPSDIKWIKVFGTEPGLAEYLIKFEKSILEKCRVNVVGFDASKIHEGEIILKGQQSLEKVFEELKQLASKVVMKAKEIRKSGIPQFLQTVQGQDIIESSGSEYNTVVVTAQASGEGLIPISETIPRQSPQECQQRHSLEIDGLTINIERGDILEAKTKAIVVSVHPSYDLSKGFLSNKIKTKAGPGVQHDLSNQSDQSFRMTSGGLLSFKMIFYVTLEGLSETLIEVLRKANNLKLESISLPAIGTGQAGKSATEMAKNLISIFHKFAESLPSPRHLKIINIVIFGQNDLQEFLEVSRNSEKGPHTPSVRSMAKNSPVLGAEESFSHWTPFCISFGPMKISIRQGDIVDETNDAIVNSIGPNFQLSEGMVSKAIKGDKLMQWKLDIGSFRYSEIQVTKAEGLRCKKIIHIVTHRKMDVKERIGKILAMAKDEKISSVSIPAIGTGRLGLPVDEVAKRMREGLHEFAGKYPGILDYPKIVDIVIFKESQLQTFISGFLDATSDGSGNDKISARIPASTQNDDSVVLRFYSQTEDHIEKAYEKISCLIDDAYIEEVLEDDMFQYCPKDSSDSLTKVCLDKHISWERSPSSDKAVTLSGPKAFVEEAKAAVFGQMRDRADIMFDETMYVWEKQLASGDWEAVDPLLSLILEEIEQNTVLTPPPIQTCEKTYKLDITAKKLDDLPLRRSLKSTD